MKYTKKPKINSLENLAGHLNKNKEDINEQDIHDQLYKYMDFWFTENPVVILWNHRSETYPGIHGDARAKQTLAGSFYTWAIEI
jgi:hypothetical protein